MKKQIYYYLICILASSFGISAMDQHYEYRIRPLKTSWETLQKDLGKDEAKKYLETHQWAYERYVNAQLVLELLEQDKNPTYNKEAKSHYKQEFEGWKREFEQLSNEYKTTQAFKDYHNQVKLINATLAETLPHQNKVAPHDLSDFDTTTMAGITTHKVICGNGSSRKERIGSTEAKQARLLQNQLQELRQQSDSNNSHYKDYAISQDPKNNAIFIINDENNEPTFILPQKNKEVLDDYNKSENAAFRDALENLQALKTISEDKWGQKSWWHRLRHYWSYHQQMSVLQSEINSFTYDTNRKAFTKSHVPQRYCNPLLVARHTHKKQMYKE